MTKGKIILMTSHVFAMVTLIIATLLSCSNSSEETDSPSAGSLENNDVIESNEEITGPSPLLNPEQATSGIVRDISSTAFVSEMGIGWNLGNSFDVESKDKTDWGNPLPTEQMITSIAKRGFRTLRIPITWSYHQSGGPDYLIDTKFLDDIQNIVDFALMEGMHVILNTHHEDPWLIPTNEKFEEVNIRLSSLWTQVAQRFINYGDYLIFETLNEPRHEGSNEEWSGGTVEGRQMVNQYHKVGLDAIRATGGNNAKRHIMISPYAASSLDITMNSLEIPNDDQNIIISIHTYFPFDFTLNQNGTANWGSSEEKVQLENELERIRNKWVTVENRPVILGEWGSLFKNNPEARKVYASLYVTGSLSRGMIPILWDNGNPNELGVFDRNNISWDWHPEVVNEIIKASKQ